MSFIEEFARLRLCLFHYVFCQNLATLLFSCSFHTTVVNDGLHEPYSLLTNHSLILILSESHMGCLIWVKFVEIPKQKLKANLMPFTVLYSLLENSPKKVHALIG